uniref:Uncharacterized protein n=1 Tax=Anguilla anguilla TaxID=7936 RepID=A0A0E9UVS1_ANGAN
MLMMCHKFVLCCRLLKITS